jgi:hypothetical protein
MTVAGPHFIALQVRDLRAATTSRETRLGLRRLPGGPPGADESQVLPDALVSTGVPVPAPPVDGPFGRTFTSTDPDGDAVTVHDRG